jgi:hypothetical protein
VRSASTTRRGQNRGNMITLIIGSKQGIRRDGRGV